MRTLGASGLFFVLVFGVMHGGCGGGGGTPPLPVPEVDPTILASGTVGPDGGVISISDPNSPFIGVTVDVPAGALADPVTIEIRQSSDPLLPENQHCFELQPHGLQFSAPVRVTVTYDTAFLETLGFAPGPQAFLGVASHRVPSSAEAHSYLSIDRAEERVTCATTHFSHFEACHDLGWRLFCQPEVVDCRFVVATDPPAWVTEAGSGAELGRGTATSFWATNRNLLLVHDVGTDAAIFADSSDDLPASLTRHFRNVAIFQYRSGRSVEELGDALFQLVRDSAGAGFGCVIVGHGLGGLVARHALEAAPTRLALPDIDDFVDAIITLSTPHAGTALDAYLADLEVATSSDPQAVRARIASLDALEQGVGGIGGSGNTPYFLFASDADVHVPQASATGLAGVDASDTEVLTAVTHAQTHTLARTNGVLDRILRWFGDPNGRIAYSSEDSAGNYDIWLMDHDGSNSRRVTTHAAVDTKPVLSPDGRWLAFASNRDVTVLDLYIIDLDGDWTPQLASRRAGSCLPHCWSPDSERIYYTYSPAAGGQDSFYVLDWETDTHTGLGSGKFSSIFVDPSETYAMSGHQIPETWLSLPQLWRMTLSNGSMSECSTRSDTEADMRIAGGYSPDGTRFAFLRAHMPRTVANTCPINPAAVSVVTPASLKNWPDADYNTLTYSPDGIWLIFSYRDYSTNPVRFDIYKMYTDGTGEALLASDANNPSWGGGRLIPLP